MFKKPKKDIPQHLEAGEEIRQHLDRFCAGDKRPLPIVCQAVEGELRQMVQSSIIEEIGKVCSDSGKALVFHNITHFSFDGFPYELRVNEDAAVGRRLEIVIRCNVTEGPSVSCRVSCHYEQ